MSNIATIIILLAVVTALARITERIKIPYPILLVVAGITIGLVPGLPGVSLQPDTVFLLFLPPILFYAAWSTSWTDMKAARRPIGLLAIGCVIFTTCAVALVAHTFIPSLGWSEAFVLGAIISPPDVVAATASTKGLKVPKRIITVLEGESLVNDATGLIVYRYAVAAVLTGTFSLWEASFKFVLMAAGGILLGLVTGRIFKWIHRLTSDNSTTDTALTFVTPFLIYLIAEEIHVSGVLAVVACGLYFSRNASKLFSHQTRLQAHRSWDTAIFILNGVIFILIGLQLPVILKNIEDIAFTTLLTYAAIISGAVILGRLLWVYPAAYIPRWMSRRIRESESEVSLKVLTIIAWSGMRGVVSLAAALALPYIAADGKPFPNRELIIFLTFSVIFSTLVIQGLTLKPLIKWFNLQRDGKEHEHEQYARLIVAALIIEHIEANYALVANEQVLNQIKTRYEMRIQRIQKDYSKRTLTEDQINQFHQIRVELLDKERQLVIGLRNEGSITEEALKKIEFELDLEEARLKLEV
jgi:monovalent cation/hydrogen antiporter